MRADGAKEHDEAEGSFGAPLKPYAWGLRASGAIHRLGFLWWLPLLISLAAIAALTASGRPAWIYHFPLLVLLLNFAFLTVISVMVALVAGRAFLLSGSPWLILLGSGAVVWGTSAVLAAGLAGGNLAARAIIFNLSVWLAAFCHLLGTLALLRRWRAISSPIAWLAGAYVGCFIVTGALARAASAGLMPTFLSDASSGTPLRLILLGSAIAMFTGSAILLRWRNRAGTSAFLEWYWMALLLIAAGLVGILLQRRLDSALTWVGRATLYAGGAYMLTAVLRSQRESGGLSLEAELLEARRRYDDLFDLAADGIVVHSLDDAGEPVRIVRANPAACSMLGYRASELAELRFPDVIAAAERDAFRTGIAATPPGGTLRQEGTLIAKDGRELRAEINSRAFHDRCRMVISTVRDVTERARMEEAIRQRAEEIQTVMDVAPVAIWVARDASCDVIVGNRAANKVYEAAGGENVSSNASQTRRLFQEGRELSAAEMPIQRAAATNSEVRDAEVEILLPSGRRATMMGNGMPLRDAEGRVRGAVGAFLDITDRKKTERALRQREQRLQLAASAARLGVFEWAVRGGGAIWENDIMYEIFGRTREDGPLDQNGILEQAIYREDVMGYLHALKKAASPDRKFHATCRIVRKNDGELRWVEFLGDFEFDADGSPVRMVGVVRDVTERRQAEQDVRKSREWLRVTLRSIGDGVIATDIEGKIVFLNPVAEELTGWSIQEALGRPIAEVFRVVREGTAEPADDVIGRVLRERGVVELSNHTALLTREGSEVPIEDSAAPILERDGTIAGVVLVFHGVAEKRLAQKVLRESEQRLRAVGDNLPEGAIYRYCVRADGGGGLEFVSAGYERLTGVPVAEAVSRPEVFGEIMPEEDARRFVEANARSVEQLTPFEIEVRLRHRASGETRWLMVRSVASRREDGSTVLDGVMLDITERKQADEVLARQEERLRLALVAGGMGTWDWRIQTGEMVWNDEHFRMWGFEPGEVAPTAGIRASRVHPEDRATAEERLRDSIEGSGDYTAEYRLSLPGGTRWVLDRGKVTCDASGQPVRSYGVVVDTTGIKEAEEQARRFNAILDARNRMLRSGISSETEEELGRGCLALAEELTQSEFGFIAEIQSDGAPAKVAISDRGRQACRAAGVSSDTIPVNFDPELICGKTMRDGEAHYCNDENAIRERLRTPEGHPLINSLLCAPLLRDGRSFGLLAVANRPGGYGQNEQKALEDLALGFVQALMRKRAEQAARAGEERLRDAQKMESIGLLAGGIAHDFNNLLVGIVGNASLAEDMLPYGSPASEALRRIVTAGEQAAHLTRQMLAYAGKGRFIIGAANISKIVADANSLIQSSISKKISIYLDLDPGAHPVESDPSQIQQVYMNLALNAAEAIGADAGVISVSTRTERIGEAEIQRGLAQWPIEPGLFTCLEVRDTGCGMSAATAARIFDPFFTTKFQGRGLGLAAVAGIVRAHKGAIQVVSAPGEGSVFRVFLPAMQRPAEEDEAPPQSQPAEREGGGILVVDDEESVCELVSLALSRRGYSVHVARGGAEAVALIKERGGEVDLVLLDMSMPGMSGQEALAEIRTIRPELRVIVSSGYSETETLRAFSGSRISGFVQKPYTVRELEDQIRSALEGTASA